MSFVLATLALTVMQLPGAYLRYIPFKQFLSPSQKNHLQTGYALWFLLQFLLVLCIFYTRTATVSVISIKAVMLLGWIPYFLINLAVIRHYAAQHIFILGVQFIYALLIHTITTSILLPFLSPGQVFYFLYTQFTLYMILFFLLLWPVREFFQKIFISYHSISNNYYWRQICLLPMLMCTNNVFFLVGDSLSAWEQLPSRVILAICTLILLKCIILDFELMDKRIALDKNNQVLSMQIHSLEDHASLLQDAQKSMSILRHDMRHQLNIVSALIQDNYRDEALHFIDKLQSNVARTAIESFCKNPLLNAALSIYITRARQEDIAVHTELDLPAILTMDSDLAVVLSNLIENAIRSSLKQPTGSRMINIRSRTGEKNMNLLIENRFDGDVKFGTDGLPVTNQQGHGLGMQSLASFARTYGASVLCSYKDGWFRVYLNIPDI